MEIELKYKINNLETAKNLWEDKKLRAFEEPNTREVRTFNAIYYDTKERVLTDNDIAFRVREEGENIRATVKWKGDTLGPLHKREEITATLEEKTNSPSPDIFKGSEIGDEIVRLLEGKKLIPILETNFQRKSVRLDLGHSLVEMSIDNGVLEAYGEKKEFLELELELFKGEEEELLRLGEKLAGKYSIEPESESKFARGLMILGKNKGE